MKKKLCENYLNIEETTSFQELRTVDNIVYDIFYKATRAKNFVKGDEE